VTAPGQTSKRDRQRDLLFSIIYYTYNLVNLTLTSAVWYKPSSPLITSDFNVETALCDKRRRCT